MDSRTWIQDFSPRFDSHTSLLSVLVLVANNISDTNNKNCVPCRFVGWVERSDTHQRKYAV
jgi:hypothetical protein